MPQTYLPESQKNRKQVVSCFPVPLMSGESGSGIEVTAWDYLEEDCPLPKL